MNNKNKSQSAIEYVLLFMIVAAAFLAMNLYIQRAVNARLHNIEIETSPAIIISN